MKLTILECSEFSDDGWSRFDCLALWDDCLNEELGRVMNGVEGRCQAAVDESFAFDGVDGFVSGNNVEGVGGIVWNVDHVGAYNQRILAVRHEGKEKSGELHRFLMV